MGVNPVNKLSATACGVYPGYYHKLLITIGSLYHSNLKLLIFALTCCDDQIKFSRLKLRRFHDTEKKKFLNQFHIRTTISLHDSFTKIVFELS